MAKRGRAIKYTLEQVQPLATASHNYYELASALGMRWTSNARSQPSVAALVRRLGVDVSHFRKQSRVGTYPPMAPVAVPISVDAFRRKHSTRAFLEPLVTAGASLEEITRAIGGQYVSATKRVLVRLGLPVPPDPPVLPKPPRAPRTEKYPREVVAPLVQTCTTYHQLAQELGLSCAGAAKDVALRLCLDTSHFVRKPYVRKLPAPKRLCVTPWQTVLVLHPVGTDTHGGQLHRALLESGRVYECEVCHQLPEWNGEPLRLQVDHIDGVGWDDRPENLRFICANCHTQTPTFCGRNKILRRNKGIPPRAGRKSQ